jgi:restriction endonuclease Mrr
MRKIDYSLSLSSVVVLSIFFIFVLSCAKKPAEENVLAWINDYRLTVDDFRDEIRYSARAPEKLDRERLLDMAIRKQILIQEAQRQGLDREKTFMKTIERYWKQALIKELLDKKTLKLYQEAGESKRDAALEAWINQLYQQADIRINRQLLETIKLEE